MFNQTPRKIVQTNRLPFLGGIIILILVMGVFMYRTQNDQKTGVVQSHFRQTTGVSSKTEETSWFNDKKFRNIKITFNPENRPKLTAGQIEAQVVSDQDLALKKQEIEDQYAAQLEIKKIEDKNRIEEKKLEMEAERSPLSIDVPPLPGTAPSNQKGRPRNDPLTDSLNEIVNMAKSSPDNKLSALAEAGAQLITNINNQEGKRSFLQKAGGDGDYLGTSLKAPRSRYEVKAGSYISAALITGINSDLPGSVDAQVTENVYDSTTGNYLLIPQGAKLVGEYNSDLTFGQMRVQVVWNRIIFPDGQSIDIGKMQGMDISGYTGFHDKVNNHYFRIYGNAVLLSLMGAGYDILNQDTQSNQQYESPRSIIAANVGQKLSDVSNQALEKNMNVQPTLVIDPGYKFKVMVMKDMVLKEIKDAQGTLADAEQA
ncbi:MAG: hypothetical protein KGJ11_05915 [Candidatus Omnitrophica bacterium]|nr:hypothetical protein [Candidatus Omnitrophota bacterium]